MSQKMKILKYTDTFEDCPKGCRGKLSYLHDDQEHKTCGGCGVIWNRIDNEITNGMLKSLLDNLIEIAKSNYKAKDGSIKEGILIDGRWYAPIDDLFSL